MGYNPNEGNNPYDETDYEKEAKAPHYNAMPTEEKLRVKADFLAALAGGANVGKALAIVNGTDHWFGGKSSRVGRKTIYTWRRYEEDFRRDWDEAIAIGNDKLEQRFITFADEIDPKQIPKALAFRNPQRYAISRQEVSGPGGGPIPVERVELVPVGSSDPVGDEPADDNSEA